MTYRFKPLPELYWGVVIAASLVLLQALLTLDPEKVVDWRVWGVALGGAAVRAAAGAALDYIRRSASVEPEPMFAEPPSVDSQALADRITAMPRDERIALIQELQKRHFDKVMGGS